METIIVKLDSKKLENAELDIIYNLPERIEEYSVSKIKDNGYDYLSDTEIGIWLETDRAEAQYHSVIQLLKSEIFCENDLSKSAEVFISAKETADIEECRKVYP